MSLQFSPRIDLPATNRRRSAVTHRFYEEGYKDGFAHGRIHGLIEGRALGREKGFEIGGRGVRGRCEQLEVGYAALRPLEEV